MLFRSSDNFAFRYNAGFQEGGLYAFELDVAIRAINKRVESACYVNGMLAASYSEISYVDAPLRLDMLQYASEFVFRGQRSGNAFEHTKIGILKCVFARDRSFAGFVGVPGAELAVSANLAGWQRVVERDVVRH